VKKSHKPTATIRTRNYRRSSADMYQR